MIDYHAHRPCVRTFQATRFKDFEGLHGWKRSIHTVTIMDWFSQVAAAQTVDAVTSNELQCSFRKTKWDYLCIGNSKQELSVIVDPLLSCVHLNNESLEFPSEW